MEYQKIDFGGKTKIEGRDRSPDYEQIFLSPPKDNTILDIGCNLGYYSIRAGLECAKKVVGIDNHQSFLDEAIKVKNELGLDNVTFECMDFEDYPPKNFDIILCLNVLHHLPTPQKVENWLIKMERMATKMIVIEVLDCERGIEIVKNRKGNSFIHIGTDFVSRTFTKFDSLLVRNSEVTKGRKFIYAWKSNQ